jgi:diguanylate cyclase (GGDEF)-like protein
LHILIAEDDALSRLLLQKSIELQGHTCLAAKDGVEAWDLYEREPVDVIISDWMMPGLDGIEFCKRVRAEEQGYTYFILLTSNADRKDRLMGMRAGADDYLTKPLDPDDLEMRLIAAARVTTLHRRILAQQAELEALNRSLYTEGRRDALTQIPNRLQLKEDLKRAQARLERGDGGYSVALFDIDCFKRYNDTLGHLAGDDTLRKVAQCLQAQCRADDKVYRYGGEEFCAVFAGQSLEGSFIAADRMRGAVEALAQLHPDNAAGPYVTVSAGVAPHPGDPRMSSDEVLQRADAALYTSKEHGRNQVTGWREPDASEIRKSA